MTEEQTNNLQVVRPLQPDEYLPAEYLAPAVVQQQLTPSNQPIPVPQWLLDAGWHMDTEAFLKPTPRDSRKVARNKEGMVLYRYAPISFFIRRCNQTWGPGNWGYEIFQIEDSTPDTKGNFDRTIGIQFVAPGLFRPMKGFGTSTYFNNNPQENLAKTTNGAISSAFKSALKQMGMGRDVEEDDPEMVKVVEGRLTAIGTVYKRLVETGAGEQAKQLVRKYAPTALLDGGELMPAAIEFEQLEPLQRALQDLVIAGAMKAAEVKEVVK